MFHIIPKKHWIVNRNRPLTPLARFFWRTFIFRKSPSPVLRYYIEITSKVAFLSQRSYIRNMKNDKLVKKIVESLLDETTFLQAYKRGILSKDDISAASKLRKEASSLLGQRIGVVSSHGRPDEEYTGSMAFTPFIISQNKKSSARAGENTSLRYRPKIGSDKLRQKLYNEKPFVELNVSGTEKAKKIIPTMGHELGHVVDPVQSEKFHAMSDLEGRDEMHVAYNGAEPSQNELSVLKSEGRAWRMGREMQKTTGTFNTPQWRKEAQKALLSYTKPYRKG